MKAEMSAPKLLKGLGKALFVATIACSLAPVLHAQEVRIRVLNGRSGKPITNECLNVWIGAMRGTSLLLPTDNEGVVAFHLENGEVTSDAMSPRACNGAAFRGPKVLPTAADSIFVTGGQHVVCQEYGRVAEGDRPTPNLVQKLMPSYSIKKILESGITASNTCGKIKAEPKPGELIIFERPTTFWERLHE